MRRRGRIGRPLRIALSVVVLAVGVLAANATPVQAKGTVTYTYIVRVKGTVRSDVNQFADHATDTLNDPKGWSLGGSIRFAQVDEGGDFTLWLSQASLMTSFSTGCSEMWSCRVGRDVIINDDRWVGGSPNLKLTVDEYRKMVVNHEVGHWFGAIHQSCPGSRQPAYLMQQQSKGGSFLGSCVPNPWPRPEERDTLGRKLGLPVLAIPVRLGIAGTPTGDGYWIVQADGEVYAHGDAPFVGSMAGKPLNKRLVGMAPTASGKGYWLVGEDGGIFSFGDAPFYGSTGDIRLNRPVVGMTSTPTGDGYWFVASDGGIFAYGDAGFFGSTGAMHLNQPIVGMASTPSGQGYWLVAKDGGIFSFGDAPFYGSTGDIRLNRPIVGMTASPTGRGYWFTATDGGIFAYGDAAFHGSIGGAPILYPVVSMSATATGGGYWVLGAVGVVFAFGDAPFHGHGD
jgi:hypothetical protein